jgi:hypothetical protein
MPGHWIRHVDGPSQAHNTRFSMFGSPISGCYIHQSFDQRSTTKRSMSFTCPTMILNYFASRATAKHNVNMMSSSQNSRIIRHARSMVAAISDQDVDWPWCVPSDRTSSSS